MALKKKELEDLFSFVSNGLSQKVINQILKPTGRGGVYASRDYITANCLLTEFRKAQPNADLSLIQDEKEIWDAIHPTTRFRLKAYTPCLAARYDELKEKEQKEIFESRDWVATTKENGVRGWLICHPDGTVKLFSRNYSDKDCGLLEYWNNVAQTVKEHDDIYAIDVEIKFEPGTDISEDLERLGLETDSPLEAMVALLHTYPEEAEKIQNRFKEVYKKDLIVFRLIHPLYFNNKNYLNRTLGEGIDVIDECVARGRELGINVFPIGMCAGSREEKEIFLDSILDNGGEGVVFHNRKGHYCISENRSKTSFIKLKRSVAATSQKQGMGDSIDAFVTGFKMGNNGTANEGLIASLQMSVYVNDNGRIYEHIIAYVPNIERTLMQALTIEDASGAYPQEVVLSDGSLKTVSLNPEFVNLVAEVDGQALSAVSQRLEHPRLIRWRVERDPSSCIYTKEWLDSQTTNAKTGIRYQS